MWKKATATLFAAWIGFGATNAVASSRDTISVDDLPLPDVYRIGGSYGEDNSYAVNASADWGVTNDGRLLLAGAYAHATQRLNLLSTSDTFEQASVEWDQRFGRWRFAGGAEYWSDRGNIESYTWRGRAGYDFAHVHVGAVFERHNAKVQYELSPLIRTYVSDSRSINSDGYGASVRWSGDALSLYADAKLYDYDQPIDLLITRYDLSRIPPGLQSTFQAFLDVLRRNISRVNATSLRISSILLDDSEIVGADYTFGEQLINVELTRDRAALDGSIAQSASVGWIVPLGAAADVELRLGDTHIDNVGSSVYGSVNFSFYR